MCTRGPLLAVFLFIASLCPAQTVTPRNLVLDAADQHLMAPVRNLLPSWATTANDDSSLPAEAPLRLTFVLARSPERQAAFIQLLADQQNPSSPNYHQWLTPQQAGERFGATLQDLDIFTCWLTAQGLSVVELAPSRVFLTVAAPAATVSRALHTSFRLFSVDGQTRFSATTDPSLPAAFAPLIQTIAGLSDPQLQPNHTRPEVHPAYTGTTGTHALTPGDFSVIYDLAPAAGAGLTGSGQKVAIIGRSRVAAADITAFQSLMGLPANLLNTIVPPTGSDPGIRPPTPDPANDDQLEAVLDLERLLGTAPAVHADLVVAADTFDAQGNMTANGLMTAAQYEVQTLLDPVMNLSFSSCESFAGPSGVNFWDTLFAQAASQGISVIVSSGDSGAAACNATGTLPPRFQGRSVNSLCSSSYATCVGATQFADTASSAQYWSTANAPPLTSALSYIPEGAWNEPVATDANGSPTPVSAATGGGASLYVPKPVWQTVPGVPADHARDLPDVSFAGAKHDGYYICYAAGGADCSQHAFATLSGTSAAAPGMAAVAALLNQKTATSAGNLNPLLYRLAASTPAAFHDATPTSSGVSNCDVNTPSPCNNSTPSYTGLTGGTAGFALTPGYDQATGLGSLDIANFLTAAAAVPASTLIPTKLTITGTAATIRDSQTGGVSAAPPGTPGSVTFTAKLTTTQPGTPTGSIQFYINGFTLGPAVALAAGQASTSDLTFQYAGYYDISAVYSGDTTFASAAAPGIPLHVTGFLSTTSATVSSTTIPIGTTALFQTTVAPVLPPGGQPNPPLPVPTGAVGVNLNGNTLDIANLSNGQATTAVSLTVPGTYQLQATYFGDGIYSSSFAPPISVTVPKLASAARISAAAAAPAPALAGTFTVAVAGAANPPSIPLPAPTGTVQLAANGTPIGAALPLSPNQPSAGQSQVTSPSLTFPTAGTYAITAIYSGDAFYLPTTSPVTSIVVPPPLQLVILFPATTPLTLAPGGTATDLLTLGSPDGDTGTFNMACRVTFNGTGPVVSIPTCTLPLPQLTLGPGIFAVQETLTIHTTAPPPPATASGPTAPWSLRVTSLALLLCFGLAPGRGKRLPKLLALLVLSLPVALSGCSFSRSPATTTSGSYTIIVTATPTVSGAPAPSPLAIPLTVQ